VANRAKGQVSVDVNGEAVNLSLTFNAICELEDLYGTSISDIVAKVDTDVKRDAVSYKDLRAILWASLLDARPDASLPDAGKVAEALGVDLGGVIKSVIEASGLFAVEEEAPEVGNAKRKTRPKR